MLHKSADGQDDYVMNDTDCYYDPEVVAVLAEIRSLRPAQQKQLRAALRSPGQAGGLQTRHRAARRLYEQVTQLLSGLTAAGSPPDKGLWAWVRRELKVATKADSLRRAYQRFMRTLERESA